MVGVLRDDEHGLLWLDLEVPDPEELRLLGAEFAFHDPALTDAARLHQCSKIDRYDDRAYPAAPHAARRHRAVGAGRRTRRCARPTPYGSVALCGDGLIHCLFSLRTEQGITATIAGGFICSYQLAVPRVLMHA